jgi:hypothetical protein
MAWQLRKKHLLPLAAGLSLSLSAASVLAEELDVGAQEKPVPNGAAAKDEDSKSFLSEHLWEGSFDKAGDASRNAEVALKKSNEWKINCSSGTDSSIPAAQAQAASARCAALKKEILSYGEEAGSIRSTQRIFADVSKASDIAAVGAIGATAYAQLGKRDPSQSSSLESVAKIQETAGYVSYASGAADISMGAYAYLAQKSKFEEMEEKLRKAKASPQLLSKVSAAAEATKQAAYSHMMYGAGKAAFGYASMYMAKQNRKQAEALTSLTPETVATATAAATATPTISGATGGSGPTYNNNQPVFSVGDGTSLSTATAASTSTSPVFSSSGGSVMRASETRSLSSASGGSFSPGGSGAAGGNSTGSSQAPSLEPTEEGEGTAAGGPKGDTYEMNTLGGSPHYGGGSSKSSSDDAGAITSLLTSALGGGAPDSAGTGVNPNQVYRDATTDGGMSGEEQGNEAGVSSANRSLFEVMRNKYSKIIQGGRVMGPGAVEVRN